MLFVMLHCRINFSRRYFCRKNYFTAFSDNGRGSSPTPQKKKNMILDRAMQSQLAKQKILNLPSEKSSTCQAKSPQLAKRKAYIWQKKSEIFCVFCLFFTTLLFFF